MTLTRPWQRHTDRIEALLRQEPVGLVTDIDGTISPIAPTPAAAAVDPACRESLAQLSRRMLVAAVSGRSAEDARRMVGIDEVVYLGNHGLDRLTSEGLEVLPEAQPCVPKIRGLLRQVEAALDLPGLIVEDKGSTASIHYRQHPDPQAARAAILGVIQAPAERAGLRLTEGRRVIEIRPPVRSDKGTALLTLIEDYHLKGVFYLGDDITDVDAFEALRAWRSSQQGGGGALALGVDSPETPGAVLASADLHLDGVPGVADFLAWLVAQGRDRQ